MTEYNKQEAIDYLRGVFERQDSETEYMIRLYETSDAIETRYIRSKISIAGFSEEKRRQHGKLEKLCEKIGSVFLYGEEHTDYRLIIKTGGRTVIYPLDDIVVRRTGFADGIIRVESKRWEIVSAIEIFISQVFASRDAFYFYKNIVRKIHKGVYTARLGKWVSRKAFDRTIERHEAEIRSVGEAIRTPYDESIQTMVIGADIESIELSHDHTGEKDSYLKVKQHINTTKIPFRDMVIEHDTPGKEIGARQSKSTYIYLAGTAINAPANLIIVRHRPRSDISDNGM